MNDSVSILVAVVLILVALRWMLGGSQQLPEQQGNARRGSPRRPQHRATPQMIEMVRNVFPNIPTAAIVADLQRTGNVERTIDNALRDGGLPLPPPPTPPPTTNNNSNEASSSSSNAQSSSHFSNLVQRYHLEKADGSQELAEPEKVWGTTADKRQEVLRKRKEFMVLQARRKMMEKQKEKEQQKTSSPTTTMATATEEEEEEKSENPTYDEMSVEQLNALSPEERRQQLLDALERRNVNS
ncbi:hypothetical protein O0I10_009532 [Lichtheimia ornata]|uniref:CUE domain-containing protein n=1 Tax=Lichtheimia ornata TaxID=688661 RepID=A0AAD7UXN2_9FUNG|nr:uncharacterized protein O0I10_009532 [Lichtheimia ornata]KAJ8654811.1 hypothetical protein O0I10_009532 [Lichtheimia ornata]